MLVKLPVHTTNFKWSKTVSAIQKSSTWQNKMPEDKERKKPVEWGIEKGKRRNVYHLFSTSGVISNGCC